MYEYIQGKLAEINPAFAILDVGGVGYNLQITLNTYTRISNLDQCRLYAHLVIREDAQVLFGFAETEERDLFRLLLTVSGIGPNTARLLLSSLNIVELKDAITAGRVNILKSVKGIGEKSAQRIIVDLRDKIDKGSSPVQKVDFSHNTIREESLSGLVILGFPRKIAEKAVDDVIRELKQLTSEGSPTTVINVERIIKEALKRL
ncbi:MAG TPA: Holliday junction branch migration protein RuvA [Bacteroidales bacterium]|jgi:Holliday junction DNA helicase RuvA|nr:Holliday junction branch migration protein RuvA [Bacteroidales bacterium]HNQ83282.1 Holliday junction branch migration protein RuvA [Bacteroidales bacterium]HOX78285.1 Holliday junction branch migration protein RuvA [Bacteroidales bacterium]HPI86989.1 Holliday junction branch migration protein RuvA [Bacteroidales bacterium]HPM91850.1 Holliday junction branch migration protein RuvA [Bacteroidales bacterium]